MIRGLMNMALMVAVAVVGPGCAYLDSNFRAVEPGVFYRSGQMSGARLGRAIRDHDIKTVVNLRGQSHEAWYLEEIGVCAALGVSHHDLDWSMNHLPDPASLALYVDLTETAARPILVHCQGGTHRAGVASAVFILLEGGGIGDARAQFGIFFDDASIGELIDLYEGSPLPFADWVVLEYPAVWEEIAGGVKAAG